MTSTARHIHIGPAKRRWKRGMVALGDSPTPNELRSWKVGFHMGWKSRGYHEKHGAHGCRKNGGPDPREAEEE